MNQAVSPLTLREKGGIMKRYKNIVLLLVVFTAGCATGQRALYNEPSLVNQGFEAIRQGKYVYAESFLEKALAINPKDPYALLNLGVVYQNTKRPIQARILYEKVIELNSGEIVDRGSIKGKARRSLVDVAKDNLQKL